MQRDSSITILVCKEYGMLRMLISQPFPFPKKCNKILWSHSSHQNMNKDCSSFHYLNNKSKQRTIYYQILSAAEMLFAHEYIKLKIQI